jgi:serine/threonine protein kinase/Tfp pilus assembly protein PilF
MVPDPLEQLNQILAGRSALERPIGSGGMATVYLADDLKHHRKVAIKVLRPDLAQVLGADRFQREIAIAARLNHPHILPLFDSGVVTLNGALAACYYVMPWIRGESLRQRLEREGRLEVDQALRITRQVAAALDHANAQGIIHRDIKPENILFSEGEALVADFGIALAPEGAPDEQRITGAGVFMGTPGYMSPEQALGEQALDARSDLYSLACVLYEMLAGQPPLLGATTQATIARRLVAAPPRVRQVRSSVPVGVEQALTRALAADPTSRFSSSGEFAIALQSQSETLPPPGPSVAVLPFINMAGDPEGDYFADGMTEDVIAQLSRIRALKVISRISVMAFKDRTLSLREIGARLQAATVLDGSVRRIGDRVRIVAQLVDAESDRHLWSETYDRQVTDIFAIQSDVALRIAEALRTELTPGERRRLGKEPTANLEAYKLYLQGRHFFVRYTREGFLKALEYYGRALALDPEYAQACVGLALAYTELGMGQGKDPADPMASYRSAKKYAARALELDAGLGEAHGVRAYLSFVCDHDWAEAEQGFRRALELNPGSADSNDLYGQMLAAQARYDEAIPYLKRAHELDPLAHRSDMASTFMRAGRFTEALAAAWPVIEFDPNYPRGHSTLGWAYLKLGRIEEGLAALRQAVALAPGDTFFLAQLGQGLAVAGRTEEARQIAEQLEQLATERYVSPYHLAYVYTGLGDRERAIDCLERAYELRTGGVSGIRGSFLFTTLRDHPRFIALLRKMNLA